MSTHLLPGGFIHHRETVARPVAAERAGMRTIGMSALLMSAGMMAVLAGAWGGIAPFVGPTFAYSPDGAGSYYWDFARAMVAVLPGCAAIVGGLLVLACVRSWDLALGRGLVRVAAVLLFASGAWFALGPSAWPVLYGHHYLISSSPLLDFARIAGFVAGPGLMLTVCAGAALGFLAMARPVETGAPAASEYASQSVSSPVADPVTTSQTPLDPSES